MREARRRISQIGLMAVGESVGRGAGWLTVFLFPFVLNPYEFGVVALLVSYEGLATGALLLGQDRAILWGVARWPEEAGRTINAAWGILVAAWSVGMLFVGGIAVWGGGYILGVPVWPHLIILGAAVFMVGTNRLVLASQKILRENRQFTANRAAVGIGRLGISLGLGALTASSLAFPFGSVLGTSLGGAWSWRTRIKVGRVLDDLSCRGRSLLRYGWPLTLHMVAMAGVAFVDRWVIGAQLGPSAVGAYTWYYMLGSSVVFIYAALAVYFEPRLYHAVHGSRTMDREVVSVFMGLTLIGSGLYGLLGMLLGAYAEPLTPESIQGPIDVTRLVLLAHWLHPLYLCATYSLSARGQTVLVARISVVVLIVVTVANLLLVPALGVVGGAWATLIGSFLLAALSVVMVRRHTGVIFGGKFLALYAGIITASAAFGDRRLLFGLLAVGFSLLGMTSLLRRGVTPRTESS